MTPFRLVLLLAGGIWAVGCIPYQSSGDDPLFAGYHRSDPSQGTTAVITDRGAYTQAASVPHTQPAPVPQEKMEGPREQDYTYQDWSRNRYRGEDAFQFNLSYHLYGPYYYRDFQTRYWHRYQRRWHNLPWYANGWWFDDLWWNYPQRGYGHQQYSWWYDPWYDYYYDPWYYDPYWSYWRPSSYYGGYGDYGWYPWYSTPSAGTTKTKVTQRRSRNRRDLPTGASSEAVPGPALDSGMTTSAAAQSGQSKTGKTSTGSAKTARSSDRRDSSTTSGDTHRSSPGIRSSSKTKSSSSKASKSTKTARTKQRKP